MGLRRNLLPALVLLTLAGCRKDKTGAAAVAPAERPPELIMRGLIVQSWGASGLEWEMQSPVGEGFTHRNIIKVSSMNVQLYENGERSTELDASSALMMTGTDKNGPVEPMPGVVLSSGDMFLDGRVVVVSTEGSRLQTDWAHYSVRDKIIRSSAPVEVLRPDSIIRGKGLEATADLSNLKIFNQTLVIPDRKEAK